MHVHTQKKTQPFRIRLISIILTASFIGLSLAYLALVVRHSDHSHAPCKAVTECRVCIHILAVKNTIKFIGSALRIVSVTGVFAFFIVYSEHTALFACCRLSPVMLKVKLNN